MAIAPYRDRASAGRLLAAELVKAALVRPVVFALPRGGVPVGVEIAAALGAPLDLLLVRKIGVPGHRELAAASIVDGERPDIILNEDVMRAAGLTRADIDLAAAREGLEIERRRALYMPGHPPLSAEGRTAILVDDGVATGASMKAAIAAVSRRRPLRVIVACPVAAPDSVAELRALADEVIVLASPRGFRGVGEFYEDFHQLADEEVMSLLARARSPRRHDSAENGA
jgi:putative phosphoribosyl transferase